MASANTQTAAFKTLLSPSSSLVQMGRKKWQSQPHSIYAPTFAYTLFIELHLRVIVFTKIGYHLILTLVYHLHLNKKSVRIFNNDILLFVFMITK
jgi:hypothetical protein